MKISKKIFQLRFDFPDAWGEGLSGVTSGLGLSDSLVWRVVNSGRATLTEVRNEWHFEDVLQCSLLLDIEHVETYLTYKQDDD